MDAILQRHCARYIYVVPDGLRELMSDISREVLRSQPADMHTFIADYLDSLLITRENARISARFISYLTDTSKTVVEILASTGISKEKAVLAAETTQEAFLSWSERKGILKDDEENLVARIVDTAGISESEAHAAAFVIQNAFHEFKSRQTRESQLLSGIVDWRIAAGSALRLYRRTGVSPQEAKRAATLIKAAYKGYYTRKMIRLLNESPEVADKDHQSISSAASSMASFSVDVCYKSKSVQIDYSSVIPHVDFGGAELITREMPAIQEEESAYHLPKPADLSSEESKEVLTEATTDKDPKEISKAARTSQEYIRDLIEERILCAIKVDESKEVFSDGDDADAHPDEPEVDRSIMLPTFSQSELDEELADARNEVAKKLSQVPRVDF